MAQLVGGFINQGATPIKILVRGIGPSLAIAGVSGALANPTLELHKPDGTAVTNDDWGTENNHHGDRPRADERARVDHPSHGPGRRGRLHGESYDAPTTRLVLDWSKPILATPASEHPAHDPPEASPHVWNVGMNPGKRLEGRNHPIAEQNQIGL